MIHRDVKESIILNKRVSLATTQLDVTPAPLSERLGRAEALIAQAAHRVYLPLIVHLSY